MGENILVDSHVWVEDPEIAWTHGVVLNIKGDEAEVKTNDGKEVTTSSFSFFFFVLSDKACFFIGDLD